MAGSKQGRWPETPGEGKELRFTGYPHSVIICDLIVHGLMVLRSQGLPKAVSGTCWVLYDLGLTQLLRRGWQIWDVTIMTYNAEGTEKVDACGRTFRGVYQSICRNPFFQGNEQTQSPFCGSGLATCLGSI